MFAGIDEATQAARQRVKRDAEWIGSIRTETIAYMNVNTRMCDIVSQEKNTAVREKLVAVWDGVLADIMNAGDEVRSKL